MENQQATPSFRSPVVDLIWSHGTLCEEIYSLLLEENRILRGSGELEKSGVLDKKRMLLNALDNSLQQMRQAARATAVAKTPVLKTVATKAQRVLLKAMLLDKENEQLLLKHALSSSSGEMQIIPKPTAKQVKKRYESQN
ncbi:MAG: hypothetical protein DVB28_001135 [Verrucomicrobia bacterium]|nr:MAG: hypothetical protein DVB28_001135 [Verrucomicrobiota bacterium]